MLGHISLRLKKECAKGEIQTTCLIIPHFSSLRLIVLIPFFSTFNWTVPFCSYLMCVIFTLGTVVLYIVPLKFLLLAWGKDADILLHVIFVIACFNEDLIKFYCV